VAKVTVQLFDDSCKVITLASKLVTISGNSVMMPITVNASINVNMNFAKSCVQIANVASNVIYASNLPVQDVNSVSL
jgi:hypothetical protein